MRQSVWNREPKLDPELAAATGRLRVLEERMLSTEDFRRLATDTVSFAERADILERAGYTGDGSLESRVLKARDQNDRLLKELSGTDEESLSTFLLLDLDYHNAKAMVRYFVLLQQEMNLSRALAEETTDNYEDIEGEFPVALYPLLRATAPTPIGLLYETTLRLMQGEEPADAPQGIRPLFFEHLKRIVRQASRATDLADTDLLADRLSFAEMITLADRSKHKDYLRDFISILADNANLETLLRVRRGRRGTAFLKQALVPGGRVPESEIIDLYAADELKLRGAWSESLLSIVLRRVPDYETRDDIKALGQDLDLCILKLAALGKRSTAGAEAVAGYWLGRRLEMKNIRIILQAVARGLSTDETLALIRPAYKGYTL